MIVVAIIAIGGYFTPQGTTVVEKTVERLGAFTGPEVLQFVQFKNSFSKGSPSCTNATSTTATSYTLVQGDLDVDTCLFELTPNTGNLTLTTMASSSAPFSNLRTGESFSVIFYNATSTTANTITLAAGTGVDLQEDEGETVAVNGLEASRLTFWKKNNTDIGVWLEAGQVGD